MRIVRERALGLLRRQRGLQQRDEFGVGQHLLAPALPERQAGAGGAVLGLVRGQREQHLRVLEQLRDLLIPLVPELLGDGLVQRILAAEPARSLALDHRERNAIHEQHGIRPAGLGRPERLHRELVRHVVDVALRMLPVDVAAAGSSSCRRPPSAARPCRTAAAPTTSRWCAPARHRPDP